MNVEKTKVVATRVTMKTAELIEEFCKRDAHVKVAKTQEEITQLLETGFEYVLQKDGLAFFRKRK